MNQIFNNNYFQDYKILKILAKRNLLIHQVNRLINYQFVISHTLAALIEKDLMTFISFK